jgi:hypothetical protein
MIFSMDAGSLGDGDGYSLYLPFRIANGDLKLPESPLIGPLSAGLVAKLERRDGWQTISVGGFADEEACRAHLQLVRASLFLTSLDKSMGLYCPQEIGSIALQDPPVPVSSDSQFAPTNRDWTAIDGFYEAFTPVVVPESMRLMRTAVGSAKITINLPGDKFLGTLSTNFKRVSGESMARAERLMTALELYLSLPFEASRRATFTGFITVLEALAPIIKCSGFREFGINLLLEELRRLRAAATDEQLKTAFNDLRQRIGQSKNESITYSLQELLQRCVPEEGLSADQAMIAEAYGARSRLLHNGRIDDQSLGTYLKFLRRVVPDVLRHHAALVFPHTS